MSTAPTRNTRLSAGVPCPICGVKFPVTTIQAHADACASYLEPQPAKVIKQACQVSQTLIEQNFLSEIIDVWWQARRN